MRAIDLIRIAIQRGASHDVVSDISKLNEAIQRTSASVLLKSDIVDAFFQRGVTKTLTGTTTVAAGSDVATIDTPIGDRTFVDYGFFVDNIFYRIVNYYTSGGVNYIQFDRAFEASATYDDKAVVKLDYIPKLHTGEPIRRHRAGIKESDSHSVESCENLPIPPAPTAAVSTGVPTTSIAGAYKFRAAYVFGDRVSRLSDPVSATIVNTNDIVTLSLPYVDYPGYDVVYTAEGKYSSAGFNDLVASTVGPRRFSNGTNVSEAIIGVAKQHFDTDDALIVRFTADCAERRNHSIRGYRRHRYLYDYNEQIHLPPALTDAIVALLMYYSTNETQYLNVARFALSTAQANRTIV